MGLAAKAICSGIFISGRPLEHLLGTTVEARLEGQPIQFAIDEAAKTVEASLPGGLRRRAVLAGDQGVVLLPVAGSKIFFEPSKVSSRLGVADETDWPLGDAHAQAKTIDSDWDQAGLQSAAAIAFESHPESQTAALLVAHRGQLVLERYGPGIDSSTQLQSWSMAKTLTAMLIGRLVEKGELAVDEPAPIAAWQGSGDPRRAITVRHLLQMSSGLGFSAEWAPDYDAVDGYPDHAYMYSAGIDCFALALTRPLTQPPGTLGAYKNGDTLILGYLIQQYCRENGEDYFSWPQRELFDHIGIRRLVLEPDPYGNFMSSGNNFGTARDWVRLGLLLLNNGEFAGRRLLPEAFCRLLRAPAPAWAGRYWTEPGPDGWEDSIYGGQLWLNRYPPQDAWPLPSDACFMLGVGGQYTFVVPSLDLVIVRLGHVLGADGTRGCLPDVLKKILSARRG
ncbi:MAG: serine hydrolase [Pseudomonadota bacterium]